jgi:hypothetical protein
MTLWKAKCRVMKDTSVSNLKDLLTLYTDFKCTYVRCPRACFAGCSFPKRIRFAGFTVYVTLCLTSLLLLPLLCVLVTYVLLYYSSFLSVWQLLSAPTLCYCLPMLSATVCLPFITVMSAYLFAASCLSYYLYILLVIICLSPVFQLVSFCYCQLHVWVKVLFFIIPRWICEDIGKKKNLRNKNKIWLLMNWFLCTVYEHAV